MPFHTMASLAKGSTTLLRPLHTGTDTCTVRCSTSIRSSTLTCTGSKRYIPNDISQCTQATSLYGFVRFSSQDTAQRHRNNTHVHRKLVHLPPDLPYISIITTLINIRIITSSIDISSTTFFLHIRICVPLIDTSIQENTTLFLDMKIAMHQFDILENTTSLLDTRKLHFTSVIDIWIAIDMTVTSSLDHIQMRHLSSM
jgi:hypothetical protein